MLQFALYRPVHTMSGYTKTHVLVNPDFVTHVTTADFKDECILWLSSGLQSPAVRGTLDEITNRLYSYKEDNK